MPYNSFINQSHNGIFHPLHPKNLWKKQSNVNNRITGGLTHQMVLMQNVLSNPSLPLLNIQNKNTEKRKRNFFSRFQSIEEFKVYRKALQIERKSTTGSTKSEIEMKTTDFDIGFVILKKDDISKFKTEVAITVSTLSLFKSTLHLFIK